MKKIMSLLFLALLLTACGSGSKTTVCSAKNDTQDVTATIDYDEEEDTVNEITYETTVTVSENGYTKESLETMGKAYEEKVKNLKGITFTYEVSDKEYKDSLTVDFKEANIDEINELGILQSAEETATKVSYKKTVENFKSLQLECK
ncbi:MAG: DUF1307 domain-containing protein [Coprobacillaceae bacterium]